MRSRKQIEHNGVKLLWCRFPVLINRYKIFGNIFRLAVCGVLLLQFGVAAGYSKANATGIQADRESLFGTSQRAKLLIQNWMVEDGLPVNAVVDINQCKRGFIWLTTYEGIVRYDGVEFRTHNTSTNPELTTNRFTWIHRDEIDPNIMWFVPEYGGIVKLKNGTFTFYDSINGFTRARSGAPFNWNGETIFVTEDGLFTFTHSTSAFGRLKISGENITNNFFVNHAVGGDENLYLFNTEEVIVIDTLRAATKLDVQDFKYEKSWLLPFKDGVLFINEGLLRYITGDKYLTFEIDYRHDTFNGIGAAKYNDVLYLNSHTGVSTILYTDVGGMVESFKPYDFSQIGLIFREPFNVNDRNYFITRNNNIFSFHQGEVLTYQDGTESKLQSVTKSFTDQDGNIWLSGLFSGLIRINRSYVFSIPTTTTVRDDRIIGIFEDLQGVIWTSTRRGSIYVSNQNQKLQQISFFPGRNPQLHIHVFANSPSGTLYAGVNRNGLARRNQDGFFELMEDDFGDDVREIRALWPQSDEVIWVGLSTGLRKLVNSVSVPFLCEEDLNDTYVQQIKPDNQGGVWIATMRAGVFYINEKAGQCLNYTTQDGIGNESVRGIYIDRYQSGVFWFATEGGGLSRYRDGEIKTVNISQGLFRDLLHSVVEDFEGRLWMSTNHGIFFVYKQDLNDLLDGSLARVRSVVFTERHGLTNSEANGGYQSNVILRENGELFFATQAGIAFFDTRQIDKISTLPVPIIDRLESEYSFYLYPDQVVLQAGDDDFTIYFTGIEFDAPHAIRFWYKLEGYDNTWNIAVNRRNTSYTNLPPKTYRFLLSAIDPLDSSADLASIAQLTIIIEPFIYQTWWFRLFLVLLVLFLIQTGYRYRISVFRRQEILLTKKVRERTKELTIEKEAALEKQKFIEKQANDLKQLNEVKDRFFSIIAHDLRGPFMGIRGLIELIRDHREELDDEKYEEVLDLLHGSAENHNKLLDNLLNWARIQLNQVKVTPTKINANQVMQAAATSWELPAQSKGLRFNMQLSDFQLTTDQNMLITILRNLISNAVKFSWPDSEIILKTYKDDQAAVFEIQDFGTGMSEKQLRKLFTLEKEVSHKGTSEEPGTGLGLVLVSDMVKMLKGTIEVNSEKGKGTRFLVKIPLFEFKQS